MRPWKAFEVFVVDTTVFVHAADEDSRAHSLCRGLLHSWREQPGAWYTTWGILYEFVRVTTHPRLMRRPWGAKDAWGFVEALVASPGLGVLVETGRHAAVATQTVNELPDIAGDFVHDLRTAVLMREHGVKTIYTRDTGFHRFPFLEPVDPLRI